MSTDVLVDLAYLRQVQMRTFRARNPGVHESGIDFPIMVNELGKLASVEEIRNVHMFYAVPPKPADSSADVGDEGPTDAQRAYAVFRGIHGWFYHHPQGVYNGSTFNFLMRNFIELGAVKEVERDFSLSETEIQALIRKFKLDAINLTDIDIRDFASSLPDGGIGTQLANRLVNYSFKRRFPVDELMGEVFKRKFQEQKGTDSRICMRLVASALDPEIDTIILVCGDGDFASGTAEVLSRWSMLDPSISQRKKLVLVVSDDRYLGLAYSNVYNDQSEQYPRLMQIKKLGMNGELERMTRRESSSFKRRRAG